MTRRRAADWALIVALAGSFALLFVRGVGDGLRNQRGQIRVGVSSAAGPDAYPTIIWTYWPELAPGDEIAAVDGTDVRGSPAIRVYDLATRAARESGGTTLSVLRAGSAFEVRVGLSPSAWWWGPYLFAASLVLSTLIVLVRAPDWHLARRFFVASWCIAVNYVVFESNSGPGAIAFEPTIAYGLVTVGSVLAVWNAQDFTLSARPVPKLQRALALLPGALFLANYVVRYYVPYTNSVGYLLIAGPNFAFAVGVLAGFTRSYARSDALERRQTRWVLLGFYVAFVGNVVANFVSLGLVMRVLGLGTSGNAVSQILSSVTGLAVPAGIFIAVLGYRWLDIEPLISAAASYTIVGVAVVGVALAFVPQVAGAMAPPLGLSASSAQWVLTMTLLVAAIPAHLHLRSRLDQRMFASRYARMSGLTQLVDEIGHCSGPEELWKLVSSRLDELFEPRALAAYARDGESFAPRFDRNPEGTSSYEADSVLVRALDRRDRPLAADSREVDPFDRAALEILGVALIVPIRADERLLAFVCLGAKGSGDIYTPEEKSRLGAVASRCAEFLGGGSETRSEPAQIFRREGDLWTIASRGKQIHLRDMRGLHYLATLLRAPGREFAALDLVRAANGAAIATERALEPELSVSRGLTGAGPALDSRARAEYRARLVALDAELADAERCADLGRLERATAEREVLLAELDSSIRDRHTGTDSERARVAVTKAIKAALERLSEAHPELGAHLAATIRRGFVCAYEPQPADPADWEV